jgi:hypothetical protein
MADPNFKKISDMAALTTAAADDIIPIVDVSEAADANKNKKITTANLRKGITNAELAGSITAAKIAGISSDPNADRIVFWDDSATSLAYLALGSGLAIADTTLNAGDIGEGNIADGAVTNSKLGADAVDDTKIADNAIGNEHIRDSAALSVIGRSSNTSGNPADIAAGADGYVLRRSGTTLGFGTVATAGIADGAVTSAKIADGAVTPAKTSFFDTMGASAEIYCGKIELVTSPSVDYSAVRLPPGWSVTRITAEGSDFYMKITHNLGTTNYVVVCSTSNRAALTIGIYAHNANYVTFTNGLDTPSSIPVLLDFILIRY